MKYWESLQFERILEEWRSLSGKEAFFSAEAYHESPISFSLYDIDSPKGIRPEDDVIDFQVKCPHCNTVHICHVPDQSNEVEYLRWFFTKCTSCQKIFHLLTNFQYTEKHNARPDTYISIRPMSQEAWARAQYEKENEKACIAAFQRLAELEREKRGTTTIAATPRVHQQWQLHHWAVAGCVLLLLISIIGGDYDFLWKFYSLPYGYYTILRLAVTATAAYLCILAGKTKQHPAITVLAAALVLLFQPIARVTFEHDTWCWIELLTIPVLVLLTYMTSGRNAQNSAAAAGDTAAR